MVYLLLTIPAVIVLFKFIEPKKLASLFAASLFISCSFLVFWGEIKNKTFKSFSFLTAVGFLALFAAPMMISRVLHYDVDFSQIDFGPMTAPEFHKYSNYAFMILIFSTFIDYFKNKKPR